ncbi:hypothetical protein ACF3NG_08945 [Aerococcaceae bacterium WGS1372]
MYIRKTTLQDIPSVIAILDYGRQVIRESGNTVQWQGNYPGVKDIEKDIKNDSSYVVVVDDSDDENQTDQKDLKEGSIVGTFCIQEVEELTYREIKGQWLNDDDYVTIHRIASNQKLKGIGQFCMNYVKDNYSNIKIDTHESNHAMIKLIEKSGFIYCGEIIVTDGTPRNAYQYFKK